MFHALHRSFAALAILLCAASCQQHHKNFPSVDRSKLRIYLSRTSVWGGPSYRVWIDGKGNVVYEATEEPKTDDITEHYGYNRGSGVLIGGRRTDKIAPEVVDALVQKFRDADFFNLEDKYIANSHDNEKYGLSIDTGHGVKELVDYGGAQVDMPRSVTDLQNAVDVTAGTGRWVRGGNGLLEWLDKSDNNFRSHATTFIALRGVGYVSDNILLAIIQKGAPLEFNIAPKGEPARLAGSELLEGAIRYGKADLFRKLVERGWLRRADKSELGHEFAARGAGCNPDLVDAAIDAGIPVDAETSSNPRQSFYESRQQPYPAKQTALARLGSEYVFCKNGALRVATAKRLLERGADPNHQDINGQTPIYMEVDSIALLNVLLEHGADPQHKDNKGISAIFSSMNKTIILRLLKAGASPEGRYGPPPRAGVYDNTPHTLAEVALSYDMPDVTAWLKAHPANQ